MSSHIGTVARKEFEDAGRSKLLWALIGLLVGFVAIGYVGIWFADDEATAAEVLTFVGLPLQIIIPIAALIAGYMAVVGERRSGSIKLLLGLPPNRTDVVFGKLLGRMAVIGTAVVLAFLVSLVLGAALFGSVPFADWFGFAAVSVLFGLTFTGLAVGVSAGVSTRGRAMAVVVGIYILLVGLWELVTAGPYYLIYDEGPPVEAETWYLLVEQLNPIAAYTTLMNTVVEGQMDVIMFRFGLEDFEAMTMTPAERYAGDAPFFLQDWFSAVVLLLWLLVPVAIGYYRFQNADL
ncbi:ABC transporter permease subunit [Natronolimnohabitans innermongolicus]|uniref:ABC-2 type transporter n=1 Tax=Natronolimnohabitans innermongolicus JCM 12255 TaxID=1227499 RepID=L9X5P4_9EURY|nr:ABC transporter permease subunit [Natronolimnohabitans innermongolicus]ELY55913.1 ABC-2 type transporter [Natronolimnohabitans innermongolicus JCM 12255]